MKKHWYITHVENCPVCGSESRWRERVYEKPKESLQWHDHYDWCNEWGSL
jgi:hypothetical protein